MPPGGWPASIRTAGRLQSDQVADFDQNDRPASPEYAYLQRGLGLASAGAFDSGPRHDRSLARGAEGYEPQPEPVRKERLRTFGPIASARSMAHQRVFRQHGLQEPELRCSETRSQQEMTGHWVIGAAGFALRRGSSRRVAPPKQLVSRKCHLLA